MLTIDRQRFLTFREAAEKSGYSYDHLRKLVKANAVAAIDLGDRLHLVDMNDLMRYKNEKSQPKTNPDKDSDR